MELNRDQLIDCVRRCNLNNVEETCKYCTNCYLSDWDLGGFNCHDDLANEVISRLEADEQKIKELTEENEYLKQQNEIYEVLNKKLEDACESYAWTYSTPISKELFLKKERANTVREMQGKLEAKINRTLDIFDFNISECNAVRQVLRGVKDDIYQVAKALLEEKNDV